MGRWGHDGATARARGPEHGVDVARTAVMVTLYGLLVGWLRVHPSLLELAWPVGGLAALWLAASCGRPRHLVRDAVLVLLATVLAYVAVGSSPGRGAAVGVVAVLTAVVTTRVLQGLALRPDAGAGPELPGLRRPADLVAVLVATAAGSLVPALVAPGLLRALDDEAVPLVVWAWWLRSAAAGFVVLAVGLRLRSAVPERLADRAGEGGRPAGGAGAAPAAGGARSLEGLAVLVVLTTCYAVAAVHHDPTLLVLTLLPLSVWAGLRLTTDHVALLVLANAVGLVALADAATGPSLPAGSDATVATTQVVVAVVSFSVLVLALHRDALASAALRERRARRRAQQQSELLEAVLGSAHEGVMVVDAGGRVLLENAAARTLLGVPPVASRSVRATSYTLHRPDGTPLTDEEKPVLRALAGVPTTGLQALVRRSGGGESCVEVSARPLGGLADGTGAVVTLRDVSVERRAAQSLSERERLLQHALDASPLGLLVLALPRDGGRRVLRTNPAMARLLGRTDLDGCDVLELADPTDAPVLRRALESMADGVEVDRFEVRLLGPGGRRLRCACSASVVPALDGALEAVLLVEDVPQRDATAALLTSRARHDALTGLPDRALLTERLDALLAPGVAAGARVGVVCCDLDGLTAVDDSGGHAVGDGVLREVARRLVAAVRPGDTVARLGGGELVVVCPGLAGEEDLALVAGRVVAELGAPYDPPARHHRVTASAGTALADPGEDVTSLLARADAAMDAARRAGGDRWCGATTASRVVPRQEDLPAGAGRPAQTQAPTEPADSGRRR